MSSLFDPGREGILDRSIDVTAATLKAVPVSGYTFSAAHKFLSDITGASGVLAAPGVALASKLYTAGVFSAANLTWPQVAALSGGAAITSVVLYNDTGTPSSSRLVVFVDTGTGIPITPNGGDINVLWDTGPNKIFKL